MNMASAILSAILIVLGGVITMIGSIVATNYSHRVLNKSEKRKILREKIEKLFILSSQMDKALCDFITNKYLLAGYKKNYRGIRK